MLEDPISYVTTDTEVVFRISGDLDIACADDLRGLGEAAMSGDVHTLRVDMSAMTFLDSAGVGALVAIRNKAIESGCALILEKPPQHALRILQLTELVAVFTIDL